MKDAFVVLFFVSVGRFGGHLAVLAPSDDTARQDHAIVVGYGRVGGVIGAARRGLLTQRIIELARQSNARIRDPGHRGAFERDSDPDP